MNIFIRILKFALPYKKTMILAILMSLLYVVTNVSSLWLTASFAKFLFPQEKAINIVQDLEAAATSADAGLNEKIKYWTSTFVSSGTKLDTLKRLCVLIFLMFGLKNIFLYLRGISFGYIQSKAITDLRNEVYGHLGLLSMSFFDRRKPGEISSILIFDIRNIRETLGVSFNRLLVEPINIFTFLFALFVI